jgi:hypothetical protein
MTIVISALTPGGIVMAGDSRTIRVKTQNLDFRDTDKKIDFEPSSDNTNKIFLIADRFGLAHSGTSSSGDWCLQNTINEFDRIVRLNLRSNLSFNVLEAAGIFNGLVQKDAPSDAVIGCDFLWAGYDPRTGQPFQVSYMDGRDVTRERNAPCGWRTDIPEYPNGCYHHGLTMLGRAGIINDFIGGKKIRWSRMPLLDAIKCIEWLLLTGIMGLKYFEGEQQLSGGDIDILAITPTWGKFVKNKTLKLFEGEGISNEA